MTVTVVHFLSSQEATSVQVFILAVIIFASGITNSHPLFPSIFFGTFSNNVGIVQEWSLGKNINSFQELYLL